MKVGDVMFVAYQMQPDQLRGSSVPIGVAEAADIDECMLALDNYVVANDPREKFSYMIVRKEICQVLAPRASRRAEVETIRDVDREKARKKTAMLKARPLPPLVSRKSGQ